MTRSREEILDALRALLAEARAIGDPELTDAIVREVQAARASSLPGAEPEPESEFAWHGMIGRSPAVVALHSRIEKFAAAALPVLLRGESGTGKDLVARILHDLSARSDGPFVAENCAAIPETLLESTLFGHVRGAFTGAVRDHPGHFVAADGGTLFLDEVGDMPPSAQAKLLRALQEGEVRPVGGERVRKVDVRVVAATNQDLERLVEEGRFRQDLYYRLNALQLELPPLRDRGDDVVLIARHLLAERDRQAELTGDAERAIRRYAWPGNVRQLQNEIQRAVALADGPKIGAAQFSPEIAAEAS